MIKCTKKPQYIYKPLLPNYLKLIKTSVLDQNG
jgi:hypothetical protein